MAKSVTENTDTTTNNNTNSSSSSSSTSTSTTKKAVLDLDKRPIHTPYVTSFTKRKTKDGKIAISSAVLKRYYSVVDAEIYFANEYVEDIADINWSISQNTMPLFGYNSYIYDEVARGNRLIQGTFSLNFISPNYLFDLLKRLSSTSITNLTSYTVKARSIKAKKVFGKVDTSLNGERDQDDHLPIWNRTFDIDVIFGYPASTDKTNSQPVHVMLQGVALQSCQTILSGYAAGTPPVVQEQYSFIARDIMTIG